MDELFSTKEVARFLNINEKMVYALVSEKGLPATKVTGKWLFPKHLVEQWIEAKTINYIPAILSPTGVNYIGMGSKKALKVFFGSALFDSRHEGVCKA